jgi:hypothetical protein
LDASANRTDYYIGLGGTAALHMSGCVFVAAAGTGAYGVSGAPANPVTFSDVVWNGWGMFGVTANNQNNGSVFVCPIDPSSMQSGCISFAVLAAGQHFSTAFGQFALGLHSSSAWNNTAFGSLAGYGVTTGTGNTFMGATSGYAASQLTGSNNTGFGVATGYALTTGGGNLLLGADAGNTLTTGSGNIYMQSGTLLSQGYTTESHTLRMGENATVNLIRATNIDTTTPKLFLDWLPASTTYANDAAAAVGGVAVGQLYRNGSVVQVRVT